MAGRDAVTEATPATTDHAPPAARPRRTRTRWRTAFFVLAGVGIVAGVAWALFGSRLLVVRSVTVTGEHLVTSSQVIAAAGVPLGTSLVSVDAGQVARRVEGIRQVASVTVSKDWPDHLTITVRERVPVVAVRMAGGGYDLVDPAGVLVVWSRTQPARMPRYLTSVDGGALRGNAGLATAAAVLAELSPALSKQVAEVTASQLQAAPGGTPGDADQVLLGLRDGKTVLWGGTDYAAQKNRELAVLLSGGAHYIDVSAPGTVVTK
jgi:cell division protein FtsQ